MALETRGIIATTHVDRQRERLSKQALQQLVDSINQTYLILNVGHDPRLPPVGRARSAALVQLPDGEWGVEVIHEYFEPGQPVPASDGRTVQMRSFDDGAIHLLYDYSYKIDPDFLNEVKALEETTRVQAGYFAKKAEVPLSQLLVGLGTVGVGAFASGFLAKLGSDAADAFRTWLKRWLGRQRAKVKEALLTVEFTTALNGAPLNVEVILTNPTDAEIDEFLDGGLPKLDELMMASSIGPRIRKVVYGYQQGAFTPWYAIRDDAIPLFPGTGPAPGNGGNGEGSGTAS